MKVCFRCSEEKPLAEFYTHPRMKDGHLNKCADCTREDMRVYRAMSERPRELDRARYQKPERKAYSQAKNKEHNKKYRARYRARYAVTNAVRDGRLVRLPCEVCGSTDNVHGHHDDYSKPLDVRWLCVTHHFEEHF